MDEGVVYDGGSGTESQGGNPAWSEFLQVVPQEHHAAVTPILEKWDSGVNERFQKVHSEYEPWKPVINSGVEPDTAQFALNLLNSLNENPQMVYNAIKEYYKFDTDGSQSGQGQVEPPAEQDPYAAQFQELRQQNEVIAQALLAEKQAKMDAEADQWLDNHLSELRTKHGDYDERYVVALMQSGMSGDEAVQHFHQIIQSQAKQLGPKPLIMGGGGGIPGQQADPTKMDDKGRKNLVVQMLQQYKQQNQ